MDNIFVYNLFLKYLKFEESINNDNIILEDSLPGYLKVYKQNENALWFYHIHLKMYIMHHLDVGCLYDELYDLTREIFLSIEHEEGISFKDFFKEKEFFRRFRNRWTNSLELANLLKENENIHSKLMLYQSKYEILEMLIFLCIYSDFTKNRSFNLTNLNRFADKKGVYKKGVMIDYILGGFSNSPNLKSYLKKAYNVKLRNIIGHNDYIIEDNKIISMQNADIIEIVELDETLHCLFEIHNALLLTAQYISIIDYTNEVLDCGILSCCITIEKSSNKPVISMHQLYCFYNYDIDKDWLDSIKVSIINDNVKFYVNDHVEFEGKSDDIKDIIPVLKNYDSIDVTILPIMPFVGQPMTISVLNIDNDLFAIVPSPLKDRIDTKRIPMILEINEQIK